MGEPSETVLWGGAGGFVALLVLAYVAYEWRRTSRYNGRMRTAALVGEGVVREIERLQSASDTAEFTLTVDVEIPGRATRQARLYHECMPGRDPVVGERIPLRVHPDNPNEIHLHRTWYGVHAER